MGWGLHHQKKILPSPKRRKKAEAILQSGMMPTPQLKNDINIIFAGGGKKTLFENLFGKKMKEKMFSFPKEGKLCMSAILAAMMI